MNPGLRCCLSAQSLCLPPMVAFGFREMVQEESHGQHLKVVAWDCLSCAAQRRSTPPPHAELLPADLEAAAAALPHGHRRSPHEPPACAPAPNPHDEQRAQGGHRRRRRSISSATGPRGHVTCRRRGRRRGRHRGAARRKYARRTAASRRAASRRGSSRAGGRRAERVPHCGRRLVANRHAKHVAICGHASARAQARRVRSVAGVGNGERAGGASDGAGSLSARS